MSATRSTTTSTTTTTTEGYYWERRRRGAAAPVLVGVLGLAALGIGQFAPVRDNVQKDLTSRSEQALQAAGLTGVTVDFSGRDGRLTGLTSPADVEKALAIVKKLDGVRVVTADGQSTGTGGATPSASTSPSASPSESASASAPAALALPQLTAKTTGGKVTLTGKVPSEEARKALVDAVTASYGAGNVTDQLTVDAGVSDAGVAGFAGVVTALGTGSAASADLTEGVVTLTGTVADAAAATAAANAATTLTGDAAKVKSQLTPGTGASGTGSAGTGSASPTQTKLIALPQVTFETGSATLTPAGRHVVLEAARILTAAPGTKVQLIGYTDDLGDWDVNKVLSTARADTVQKTLVANGVAAGTLSILGLSENNPKVKNDSPAHRAQNRRVEFVVLP